MVLAIGALVFAFGLGFGLGRVKNTAKLAAVKAEVAKIEASASAEVAKLIAAIKAKL